MANKFAHILSIALWIMKTGLENPTLVTPTSNAPGLTGPSFLSMITQFSPVAGGACFRPSNDLYLREMSTKHTFFFKKKKEPKGSCKV